LRHHLDKAQTDGNFVGELKALSKNRGALILEIYNLVDLICGADLTSDFDSICKKVINSCSSLIVSHGEFDESVIREEMIATFRKSQLPKGVARLVDAIGNAGKNLEMHALRDLGAGQRARCAILQRARALIMLYDAYYLSIGVKAPKLTSKVSGD